MGNLVKILHGTKGELLLDVVWHPIRPIIASISSGLVSIWAQNQVENWSAFAPDFKELDENVEYEEHESEFDISDEDKTDDSDADAEQEEEMEVDIMKIDPIAVLCSSDDEGEPDTLQFLPMAPEVEDPEDGWASNMDVVVDNGKSSAKETNTNGKNAKNSATPSSTSRRKKTVNHDVKLLNPPVDGKLLLLIMIYLSLSSSPLLLSPPLLSLLFFPSYNSLFLSV